MILEPRVRSIAAALVGLVDLGSTNGTIIRKPDGSVVFVEYKCWAREKANGKTAPMAGSDNRQLGSI